MIDPDSYVRRMLINEFQSWRRRRLRMRSSVWLDGADVHPDHADQHADRDALRTEIARLPRRQQVVLALRYYGGLSDTEIAAVMGCRPGTVRGYASRALASLRVDSASRLIGSEERAR